jgi:hypothetical protein
LVGVRVKDYIISAWYGLLVILKGFIGYKVPCLAACVVIVRKIAGFMPWKLII